MPNSSQQFPITDAPAFYLLNAALYLPCGPPAALVTLKPNLALNHHCIDRTSNSRLTHAAKMDYLGLS